MIEHLYGLFCLLVYNFNVLGYHTYVVGNALLIVHNKCVSEEKGVYELNFDDNTKYIGKGSRQRMNQSINNFTKGNNRKLVSSTFTPCTSDKASFMLEHIKMMRAGFGTESCTLLNKIFSPGKKLILNLL